MAHLILAIGIHRKRRLETSTGTDLVQLECRKRVFWCAYSLDNYLSAVLGRPRTFHDDDIDQVNTKFPNTIEYTLISDKELPACVNDSDLIPQSIDINRFKGQSIMLGAVAHTTYDSPF